MYLGSSTTITSDDRFKHNEVDISGLKIIRQLNPQFYQKTNKMLDEDYHGDLSNIEWHYEAGFIAQEVQAVFPEIVHELYYQPGYYGVDYSKLPAVLIEAIKELDTKLTNIENQLNSGN